MKINPETAAAETRKIAVVRDCMTVAICILEGSGMETLGAFNNAVNLMSDHLVNESTRTPGGLEILLGQVKRCLSGLHSHWSLL